MVKRILAVILAMLVICSTGCRYIDRIFPDATLQPTSVPSETASDEPVTTDEPTELPTESASEQPTDMPTEAPTDEPTNEPSEVPTEAPTAKPTEEPTPAPTEVATTKYKCRSNVLNVRSAPKSDAPVVGTLKFEEEVQYICSVDNSFASILYKGKTCYCYASYLVPAKETLYGYLPPQYEYKTDDHGNIQYDNTGAPIMLTSELIDIRLVVPSAEIYQIFGTNKNFTGEVLYKRSVPVIQTGTAKKLMEAAKRFAQDGYRIKIYDCYRPKSVQYILYDIVQNSAYIANPYNSASNHNRAAAVDMTLIGPDGKELEFPSPMHTFTPLVYRSSRYQWTEEQRKNVDYMTSVMLDCGFKLINTEWWHFSDTDYPSYIVLDVDMRDIPMYTARQLGF